RDVILDVARIQQHAARQAVHHDSRYAEYATRRVEQQWPRRRERGLGQRLEQAELALRRGLVVRIVRVLAIAAHDDCLTLARGAFESHQVDARRDPAAQRPHAYDLPTRGERITQPRQRSPWQSVACQWISG